MRSGAVQGFPSPLMRRGDTQRTAPPGGQERYVQTYAARSRPNGAFIFTITAFSTVANATQTR